MDRWAARAKRKSDERAARWQERRRERARSGQVTAADRWMARAQRKSDERAAQWHELERCVSWLRPPGQGTWRQRRCHQHRSERATVAEPAQSRRANRPRQPARPAPLADHRGDLVAGLPPVLHRSRSHE